MIREMMQTAATGLEGGFGFMLGAVPEVGPKNVGVISMGGEIRNFGAFHVNVPARTGVMPSPMAILDSGTIHTPTYDVRSAGSRRPGSPHNIGGQGGTRSSFAGSSNRTITHGSVAAPRGMGAWMVPGISIAASSYFMYAGYQENGMKGLYDALVLDLAASTSIANQAYSRQAIKGTEATYTRARTHWFGSQMLTGLATGLGAYAGAGIGQEIAGPVGAFAGAFAGARLMRSPLAALGTAAIIGGSTAIMKAGGTLLKSGYRRSQQNKMAHTAGSTAAFMTQGAVTMRQRAVQAMHKSHLNARSALGQEATLMHRPINYFSTYR